MSTLRGIVALLLLSVNTIVLCVPLYLLGLLRLVSPPAARTPLSRSMDGTVQLWVRAHRGVFRLLRLTRLRTHWDDAAAVSTGRWYLVVSNHQSWADILILQNVLWGRVPMLKFFTKRQLIWVPMVGLAMWFLGFPYVRRLSRERIMADPRLAALDRQATLDACRRFRDHPTSVLAFLEGTRFTAAKHAAQDARFEHLLNPKLGGASYVVTTLKDRLHKVLDVTLVYPDGVPTFWSLLKGDCPRVEISVESHDLPRDVFDTDDPEQIREILRPWVETLWRAKDARLKQTGGLAEPVAGGLAN